jgi:hypothetical protein
MFGRRDRWKTGGGSPKVLMLAQGGPSGLAPQIRMPCVPNAALGGAAADVMGGLAPSAFPWRVPSQRSAALRRLLWDGWRAAVNATVQNRTRDAQKTLDCGCGEQRWSREG